MLLFFVDINRKCYYNIVSILKEWLIIIITNTIILKNFKIRRCVDGKDNKKNNERYYSF